MMKKYMTLILAVFFVALAHQSNYASQSPKSTPPQKKYQVTILTLERTDSNAAGLRRSPSMRFAHQSAAAVKNQAELSIESKENRPNTPEKPLTIQEAMIIAQSMVGDMDTEKMNLETLTKIENKLITWLKKNNNTGLNYNIVKTFAKDIIDQAYKPSYL